MIPKIIHYCWFGKNEKSGLINACIESWKKYLPDYEIVEWNEDNFNVNCCDYVKEAYESKKWAFVSDYARLWALYNYGGIYLDTDVEVLKPFDSFLSTKAFTGFEANDSPITAVMGAQPELSVFYDLMQHYDGLHFVNDDGSFNLFTNTHAISDYLIENGCKQNGKKQTVKEITIFPQICFCPNNISRIWNKPSSKSFAIHHFSQSWTDDKIDKSDFLSRMKYYVVGKLRNTIGTYRLEKIRDTLKKS